MTRFEFQIGENFHRKRLDEFLFNEFSSLSKAYLRRTVKEGGCEVNGLIENRGRILKKNDFIEVELDRNQEKGMKPEEIPIKIVYEDEAIIVVDKPSGMLVHPTNYERNGTLLNGLSFYLNKSNSTGLFIRPHLIHRLDRETSGLMVIAKTPKASRTLCNHFKRKLFEKKYFALVNGEVEVVEGVIEEPIGRYHELKMWNVMEGGKPSETRFRFVDKSGGNSLLELEPVTGRTNQLRIHCAHIGHPIVGDEKYGGSEFQRMCLHASKISFWHPNGGAKIELSSEISFESKTG